MQFTPNTRLARRLQALMEIKTRSSYPPHFQLYHSNLVEKQPRSGEIYIFPTQRKSTMTEQQAETETSSGIICIASYMTMGKKHTRQNQNNNSRYLLRALLRVSKALLGIYNTIIH